MAVAAFHDRRSNGVEACNAPIYNTYEGGGALIWFVPDKKVFIDNRQDPYPAALLSAAHRLETDGRYQPVFTRPLASDVPSSRRHL